MADRPAEVPFFLVERLIREAMERGEFDDLPGAGKPIADLDTPHEPDWWAKRWLTRHALRDEADRARADAARQARRLRAAGRSEEAAEVLDWAASRIAEINAFLPRGERVPPPQGRNSA